MPARSARPKSLRHLARSAWARIGIQPAIYFGSDEDPILEALHKAVEQEKEAGRMRGCTAPALPAIQEAASDESHSMPARVLRETTIDRGEAARFLSLADVDTVSRYIEQGHEGVFLAAVRVGKIWRTSVEACERFAAECTARHLGEPVQERHEGPRERARRLKAADEANRAAGLR